MLHIKLVVVGKLKERFWAQACDEYLKRLRPYAQLEICELADIDPDKVGGETQAVEQESRAIISAVDNDAHPSLVILMDIDGKLVASEAIAQMLEEAPLNGHNDIVFIIGGSYGVSQEVRKKANLRWSFGRITLPHNLARVVLLEQIYRAFKIKRGEPYHK